MTAPRAADSARRVRLFPGLAGALVVVLALAFIVLVRDLLLLGFIALLIAVYLDGVTDRLVARTRLPQRAAFTLAVVLTVAALVGIGFLLVPPVVAQSRALLNVLPDQLLRVEAFLEVRLARIPELADVVKPGEHRLLGVAIEQARAWVGGAVPRVFGAAHWAVDLVAVAVMSIYFALEPRLYQSWALALVPPAHRPVAETLLARLGAALNAWTLAQLLAMAILGTFTALGLWLLDVPYWLAFGIFTGLVAVVPFFGTFVSTLLPALFVLGGDDGSPGRAVAVVVLGVVVHLVENNIVNPLVMQRQVSLPPVFTIMSVLICSRLLGPLGLLVAVPTLAVVLVTVRTLLLEQGYRDTAMPSASGG